MAPSMPNFSNFHPQQPCPSRLIPGDSVPQAILSLTNLFFYLSIVDAVRDAWQPQGTSTAMLASWALSCLLALIIPVAKWATERNSYYAYQG
eukprot:scaffold4271_cov123-Skeletonema_marinoi.AAC.10